MRTHYPARDLSFITAQGGRTRRHRYLQDIKTFTLPILAASLLQIVVYVAVITRPGRADWFNIGVAAAVLAAVPILSGLVLAALRRNESALITSAIVTGGLFSFAVSALSATRIPLSYQALAACLPVALLIMGYINARFHRTLSAKVALASFSQADRVAEETEAIEIIASPQADISRVEILLIDPVEHHREEWSLLLAQCYLSGIEIMPWTQYLEIKQRRLNVASFDIAHLIYSPTQLLYARVKRFLDILAVLVTLPVTVPMGLAVAAYIIVRDGAPVLYIQHRLGYGGRVFRMYKLRTMYRGKSGGATHVGDVRIIPGCNIIRKFRLDELPQLYNILIGDMSLIGPRPEALDLAKAYERTIRKYPMRLLVLPGLTGWAQVNSGYSGNEDEALLKLSYDLYYIKHLSVDLDILILFKTIKTVLFGHGAR